MGNAGHPTRRFDQIRKLIKRGEVKIIGGGTSGKPVVAMFLKKTFNRSKTIDRKFAITVSPGYKTIGFAVVEAKDNHMDILYKGECETGIDKIRGKMDDRRTHRRRRRYLARFRKRRMAEKHNRPLAKFKKPRNIRSIHKTNVTLQYGVKVHLNLYDKLLKLCPLPAEQTTKIMEANTFNIRKMTWGACYGKEYKVSPRITPYIHTDTHTHTHHSHSHSSPPKVCFVCGSTEHLQKHHLIQRKQRGTDVSENLIFLCKSCHEDVHLGHIYLPIAGMDIKQWRALGTMNAIAGSLQHKYRDDIHFIPAYDMAAYRRELGLSKDHDTDAVANAMLFFKCSYLTNTPIHTIFKKVKRHSRARIHALRERHYKLDGKTVACNRRKRTDQKDHPSLKEFRQQNPSLVGKLKVYPGKKSLNPFRKNMPTITGDVWTTDTNKGNARFVANGVTDKVYLYSPMLTNIISKNYIKPDRCRRIIRHEGIVVMQNRLQKPFMQSQIKAGGLL